jgi:hypothetical protein
MNRRLWILALTWITAETWYFGWNWVPHSNAEIICDGIGMLIMALAIFSPRSI